jgi:Tol biopolymer transport system component
LKNSPLVACPPARLRSGIALCAILGAAFALAGCSPAGNPVSVGGGDTGGTHLVVFASDRNQPVGQYDIYLYDLDELGFRQILHGDSATAADPHPTISPDGQLIAFDSNHGTGGGGDILFFSRSQQHLVSFPGINTTADETEPAFTGNSQSLAFTRTQGGVRRIRLYDSLGDTLRSLPGLDTTAAFNDYSPSPDQTGRRIAFVSDRSGAPHVYVWDDSLKKVLDLPDLVSAATDVDPALTPDGHTLCFASNRATGLGLYDLYLYDLPSKTFIPLPAQINSAGNERHPSISRSGDYIAFQSDRGSGLGKWDVWNCSRPLAKVGQGTQESSTADDIEPVLLAP